MFTVICYDISDDRRRYRIEKELKNNGYRVQESVLEAHISEKDFLRLRRRLSRLMDLSVDNMRYYVLCQNCISAIEADGIGIEPEDDEQLTLVV